MPIFVEVQGCQVEPLEENLECVQNPKLTSSDTLSWSLQVSPEYALPIKTLLTRELFVVAAIYLHIVMLFGHKLHKFT